MEKDRVLEREEFITTKDLDKVIDNQSLEAITNSLDENNNDEDYIALFNQSMRKKHMARLLKLSGLSDKVIDLALDRINSGDLEDKDVIGYMRAIQQMMDSSNSIVNKVPENLPIQVTNGQTNNITINAGDNLNREQRENVLNIVSKIIENASKDKGETK